MLPHEKLNLVLSSVLKYAGEDHRGIMFPVLSTLLANSTPIFAAKHTWDASLMAVLDRIEAEEYISGDLHQVELTTGKTVGEYYIKVTEDGKNFLEKGGYNATTKYLEISDGDLGMLSIYLAAIPYYEGFNVLSIRHDLAFRYKYEDRLTLFQKGIEKRIEKFLKSNRFSMPEREYDIVLTEKGRALKEAGDYDTYVADAKAQEAHEVRQTELQDRLLNYQKENAEWQKTTGNKIASLSAWMLGISIGVAAISIVVNSYVAYYISQNSQPPIVKPVINVSVDPLLKQKVAAQDSINNAAKNHAGK